jgi:menaquinone-dependent protoporphyrinogen oxidase
MQVLIIYGSTEGHTRELCRFVGEQLQQAGHTPTIEDAGVERPTADPEQFGVIFLAASLHVGRYQASLAHYAHAFHETLNAKHSAFISVSLSAAGENLDDWEGLGECLARFEHETAWTPKAVHQTAGAIRYSRYDFFKRLAIKFIAAKRGQETVMSRDYDLPDYQALRQFVLDFVGRAGASTG